MGNILTFDLRLLSTIFGGDPLWNGLIHYWSLNESSGNRLDNIGGWTLQPAGNPTTSTTGIRGACPDLSGVHGPLRITGVDIPKPLTFSCWAKPNGVAITSQFYGNIAAVALEIDPSGADNIILYMIDDSSNLVQTTQTASGNAWHSLIYDWSGNSAHLYVDNGAGSTLDTSGLGVMGINKFDLVNFIPSTALIDEVAIWNRVLDSDERTKLYNGGAGKFY